MPERSLAVFFAKRPDPGQVKTRLCPPLDPVAAAELYHCLLMDLFHRFGESKHSFHLAVAYYPQGAEEFFERITPAGTRLILQKGADLAERITSVFDETFGEGFEAVTILGTDVPFLSPHRVRESFESLREGAPVTIGPDGGGGYYLLGLTEPAPFLFQSDEMSEKGMLEKTILRVQGRGWHAELLPHESDIDYPEDLLKLVETVSRKPELKRLLPHTTSFLLQLGYLQEHVSN